MQARKRFGQNFLRDNTVIDRILAALAAQADDCLVEIGPGHGALTKPLLARGLAFSCVEIDRDLSPALSALAPGQLQVYNADALQFDFSSICPAARKLRLFGNLPYNISTPLLFHLLSHIDVIQDLHFMLQKEVVDRICAAPGNKHYGRLGIMLQAWFHADALFNVPASAFTPVPKVESAIIRLRPRSTPLVTAAHRDDFAKIVTAAFAQRRKTLANALRGIASPEQLSRAGIDPKQRAEQLPISAFAQLAALLQQATNISS